ncbi:unnamed protein product [Phytophthora fragariaefolia]|uniref:Unnamed protein product n=1 Tax=Phytophthora fragariaefolia TaxID=1490495 RepID=A0A9W6YBL7_9STRA|nr:unnamed protein product [Phytophthora fragariaefolia]
MSTPTTQAASTPAASAAGNVVVASSATTGSSPASTSVVPSTVTTPSSPKRTMLLGDYKQTRGNALFARDELDALFDVSSCADMKDGEEEDEGTSSSTPVDPSVGHSTSSNTVVSRTGPVRDPWMPTPSEIQSRFGSTAPLSQYALYSCSGIKDADVTKEPDFDPATDHRRDYYIGLFHELRWRAVPSRAVASKMMMSLRSSNLTRRRIKDAITIWDTVMSSDGTGIRIIPEEAECPSGRHSVKARVLLLQNATRTQLITVSAFA